MGRIKNQPSNSTSYSDNALRLLVYVACKYIEDFKWRLHFQSGVAFWRVILREVYFWRPKSRLKGILRLQSWTHNRWSDLETRWILTNHAQKSPQTPGPIIQAPGVESPYQCFVLFCFSLYVLVTWSATLPYSILFYSSSTLPANLKLPMATRFYLLISQTPTPSSIPTERGRAGLFLLPSKLTFKHSLFAKRPLIKRPNHSFAYLCTLSKPGWVGGIFPCFQIHA